MFCVWGVIEREIESNRESNRERERMGERKRCLNMSIKDQCYETYLSQSLSIRFKKSSKF